MDRVYLPFSIRRKFEQLGLPGGQVEEFDCHECTKCCETVGNPILATLPDIYRISKHLNISMTALFEDYLSVSALIDASKKQFEPLPDGCFPVAIHMDMPCQFLHPEYMQGREHNCTIYDTRWISCRMPPFLFYDPDSSRSRSETFVPNSFIASYTCINSRHASIDDVLQSKAFTRLFTREMQYTIEILYTPRLIISDGDAQIFKEQVGHSLNDPDVVSQVTQFCQKIRYLSPGLRLDLALTIWLATGKTKQLFKDEIIARLERIAEDRTLVSQLDSFSEEYANISRCIIPGDVKLENYVPWPPKRRRR